MTQSMTQFMYHIHVDPESKKATTKLTAQQKIVDAAQIKEGDQVSFQSDYPGTVIRYIDRTPFKDLAPGREVKIPAGPYTLRQNGYHPDQDHFECGTYVKHSSETQQRSSSAKPFHAWSGGNGTPHLPIGT